MISDHFIEGIPITLEGINRICCAAFDGNHYFLLPCREYAVIKSTRSFEHVCTYPTCRKYDCICYDKDNCCFWAGGRQCGDQIYKLDCKMQEIDHICLTDSQTAKCAVASLSCSCCSGRLIASVGDKLVSIDKKSGACSILHEMYSHSLRSVLSLCPGYLVVSADKGIQTLSVISSSCKVIKTCRISPEFCIQSMVFNPCGNTGGSPVLEIFSLKKECYSYLYRMPLSKFSLGYTPCPCNYRLPETQRCGFGMRTSLSHPQFRSIKPARGSDSPT